MASVTAQPGARLAVAKDLLVDRHYRGAIVMIGATMFAISEEAVCLVERVQRSEPRPGDETCAEARDLVSRGVLRVVENP